MHVLKCQTNCQIQTYFSILHLVCKMPSNETVIIITLPSQQSGNTDHFQPLSICFLLLFDNFYVTGPEPRVRILIIYLKIQTIAIWETDSDYCVKEICLCQNRKKKQHKKSITDRSDLQSKNIRTKHTNKHWMSNLPPPFFVSHPPHVTCTPVD